MDHPEETNCLCYDVKVMILRVRQVAPGWPQETNIDTSSSKIEPWWLPKSFGEVKKQIRKKNHARDVRRERDRKNVRIPQSSKCQYLHCKIIDFRYTLKQTVDFFKRWKFENVRIPQTSEELFGASEGTLSAQRTPWRTLKAPKEQL